MIILQRVGLVRSALAVVLGLTLAGCGGGGEDDGYTGPRGTVKGKTSYAGKPLPKGCIVSFETFDGNGGTGEVDGEGNYEIVTTGGGLPVGKYMVSVSPPPAEFVETKLPSTPEEAEAASKAAANSTPDEGPAVDTTIPEKYQVASSSGLEFEVKEGENTYNVELAE